MTSVPKTATWRKETTQDTYGTKTSTSGNSGAVKELRGTIHIGGQRIRQYTRCEQNSKDN